MTVASCPSCKENVTVPVDATPDCVVRCPLCHEEFQLEAFLTQLPPALIVLPGGPDDSGSVNVVYDESPTAAKGESSSSNVLGAFLTAEPSETANDSAPAFDFTPGSAEEGDAETTAVEKSRRRRKKNPTLEVIKILAGALLAVPAAQIILWMLPGDMKRDLLGIGPSVSRVAPWIVPEKFHAPAEHDLDASPSRTNISPPQPTKQRARNRASSGSALEPPQTAGKKTTGATDTSPATSRQDSQPSTAVVSKHGKPLEPQDDSLIKPKNGSPTASERATAEKDILVQGVRGATRYDMPGLNAAFETALQASVAWDTDLDLSDQRRAELNAQFYDAFAQLSEAVTFPPPNNPEVRQLAADLRDALGTFATQPKKLAMIGNQSATWLDRTSRPSQGVFMFGTVKKMQTSSELYETELELAALQKRTVTVVSRIDPRSTFHVGDRILMMGAIVDKPERNLLGYEGKEPMVVMGGFPVLLR